MSKTEHNITVSERKFNGTSTMNIVGAPSKKLAKATARQFFKDEYGHSPSKVVAEEDEFAFNEKRFTVMVADHSSGSLKDNREYDFEVEDNGN